MLYVSDFYLKSSFLLKHERFLFFYSHHAIAIISALFQEKPLERAEPELDFFHCYLLLSDS